MKRKYISVLIIVTVIFTIAATTSELPNEKKEYENLKVLSKDISEQKLDSIMDHFRISLGVRCNFCHAQSADTSKHRLDFASDAKEEKEVTRYMMKMTDYLNSNFFNPAKSTQTDTLHAVVCYTCHRGSKSPDSKVFLSLIDSTNQAQRREWNKKK